MTCAVPLVRYHLFVIPDALELWAAVLEAPGYEVSSWGRVRRGAFDVASWPNAKGYHLVSLEIEGVPRLRYVHRLVLTAFAPLPVSRDTAGDTAPLQVNHDDGDKAHNMLANLAWTTPGGNVAHAWARGLLPRTRVRRPTCGQGHLRDQPYRQRDRHGVLRTYARCRRCRRLAYRRARDARRGLRSLPFPPVH